uniref:VWFA domain-containing protein n=1 Tax=Ornithorhynchus anatinus TaxID=9258 RepID=A0A6I8N515_ORNAN
IIIKCLAFCCGFNLETENPMTFQMGGAGFGQSVVQLVVADPLERESAATTGRLYKCDYGTGRCTPILLQPPAEAVNMSLGLSLAARSKSTQLLACGPTVHRACGKNTYLNGFCFLLSSNLLLKKQIPEALQGESTNCPKQESDVAFLIDGSGSIAPRDFEQMKRFIRAVLDRFQGTSTLFALMQFSNMFRTHFTFDDFKKNSNPEDLINPISRLTGLTYTASGIKRVVEQLFSQSQGARKDANKILIVITDGQKYKDPLDYSGTIPLAEAAGIIRYAIGVGTAFRKPEAREELDSIASDPPRDHVFQVNDFGALDNIRNKLQEKIFAIEGTQTGSSSSFQHEMSQEGFSALLTPDGPVLGAVGSFDWSGGVTLYPRAGDSSFINISRESGDMNDAYLGYSADVATQKGIQGLVLGAPRYQHTGKVVMFRKVTRSWNQWAEVTGAQIGSYFGATVCTVDVDRDGSTELVLIGAPHHYAQNAGGLVSVCPMPLRMADWRCESVLRGQPGHPLARFGAALAVMGDTNGDGLADVAVGAPGEEENRGAVYLFHGQAQAQINPTYSQRIGGSQISPGLRYFGQALSGGQDLTQDGLVDVAVGARGRVLLLRSRPVLRVDVSLRFVPPELARAVFDCGEQMVPRREAGEVRVCLNVHKSSRDQLGDSATYDLALDPGRLSPRAIFVESQNWTLRTERTVGLGESCVSMKLLLPMCVEESVTPIVLRLNLSLWGRPIASSGRLRPVLAAGSQDLFTASLPFEKNCGADSICQDDLSVAFSFSSQQTLVVGTSLELNITVTVRNEGEDSYGTLVTFSYPPGLSHRRVSVLQVSRTALWGAGPGASGEQSTGYLNFSASEEKSGHVLQHQYHVNNLGLRTLNVTVAFWIPVELDGLPVWTEPEVVPLQVPTAPETFLPLHRRSSSPRDPRPRHLPSPEQGNCSVAVCRLIRCLITSFQVREELTFTLKGNLSFGWAVQAWALALDGGRGWCSWFFVIETLPPTCQAKTVVERYEVYSPLPIIVGSSVGGLVLLALLTAGLYKVNPTHLPTLSLPPNLLLPHPRLHRLSPVPSP